MGGSGLGVTWLEAEVPSPYRLIFTNRRGGLSEPPYDSLNLGFKTGDDPERVLKNRRLVSAGLTIPLERWTLLRQVHSSRVLQVGPEGVGAGSGDHVSGLGDADAMVTREEGAALCVLTADCVPVAIYGGEPPAAALVHSGWRGTLHEIAAAALRKLEELFGIEAAELGATLGPGIRRCCYEVDEERAQVFKDKFGRSSVVGARLDLFQAIRTTLTRQGVRNESIVDSNICTACDGDYYSFRRDGVTGRQAAMLWIRGREGDR